MMENALLQGGSPTSAGVRICQAGLNIVVLLLFALCAYVSYQHFLTSRSIQSFGILAVNALFLGLFLARRPAAQESPSLSLWLLGVAGTALPLLLRPSEVPGFVRVGSVIQVTGMILIAAGLLSLRRSFAVVPANRGVRVGGLYRIVRHPIYISELVAVLGAVLVSPTALNWLLWLCECGLQVARARAEENLLASDPAYCLYRERVRYRLIPGVI
jgi:protein-S-isoprenylcysteine O-methyltransferase Ste14